LSLGYQLTPILAILGSSGSGKTSLLNVLAGRIRDSKLDINGQLIFNGVTERGAIESAYVMQQDVLIPTLTVRETLRHSADLRLRGDVSKEERHNIVEEVILELSLKEAADTRLRYCSGGEKRRTSLAIQLLANPSVLWLDEPTTGLDATSAYQLVTTLKALAAKGRTVILTIHQPRSEIWTLFDRVVLLSQGNSVFAADRQSCMEYFARQGYPLPAFCNPAEHVIDVAAIDNRSSELEIASQTRVDNLKAEWAKVSKDGFGQELVVRESRDGLESSRSCHLVVKQGISFSRQLRVLTSRVWLTTVRDPLGLFGTFFEAICMGIIMGWIFYQLDGSLGGIRSRTAAMYVASALQGYLILMYETYRMGMDVQIFDRERAEGVVSVSAFLLSRRIAKFIEDLAVPLLFSLLFYFMTGFRTDGETFMIFFLVVFISHYIAVAFATVSVAISRDFAIASLIGNLSFTWQTFACGFFVLKANMPVYVRWSRYTAYVWYAFGALCTNEFAHQFYDCPSSGGPSDPACASYRGDVQLITFGIPGNWIWRPIVILVAFAIGYFLLSGIILQVNRQEIKVAKGRMDETDSSAGKERMTARSAEDVRFVTVRLEGYQLNVARRARNGFRLFTEEIPILKSINTVFEPGTLNVIMGPSGSGKTSLLTSIASRLKSDLISRYQVKGKLLLNGSEPSKDVLQSIVSFVTQDDDALLSKLTVRETLRFAAGLRLPNWMSKDEKHRRAEDVLLQMGLKDCANSIVGSNLVKGISGGERRRCTIAIQILTDPRILLLDEPTSGLDGFTAASIMEVLKGLADEGRTIVMTIHQSRSDLWPSFGNILLLARGGSSVYTGPRDRMLAHFDSLGYKCPETTNPADFALDLITIDLRHEDQETATREKVQGLINKWNEVQHITSRPESTVIATPAELGALQKQKAPFRIAFPILVHRSWLNLWRQPALTVGRIMQIWGLGILVTFFFAPLKTDYYSIQSRLGFIQEIAPVYFVGMLNNIAVYPFEQAVFYKEHDDRAYDVEAFIMQYTALELPFEILVSFLFAALADIAAGLPRTATAFFVMSFNVFCIVNCGESLGILFNTLISHAGFAVNVMSVFLSVAQIMGGTMAINIPGFLQAFNHLSPVKWSIQSLAHIAFDGISFSCLESQRLADGSCPRQTGEDIRSLYKLDLDLWKAVLALGAVTVGYRIFAYVVLKGMREKWYNVLRKLRR
jgi:ABC-type multidrug transport system ATPase subunit/ABC-type multidrug transport system permease subunit